MPVEIILRGLPIQGDFLIFRYFYIVYIHVRSFRIFEKSMESLEQEKFVFYVE